MNYLWSFLFLALSLNAAYNPFFREVPKVKAEAAAIALPALPPLAAPPPILVKPPLAPTQITYSAFMETKKGRFALLKVSNQAIVLTEGSSFYVDESKYLVKNITSNYVTVSNGGRSQMINFTSGGK